jgi:hypothetical protein
MLEIWSGSLAATRPLVTGKQASVEWYVVFINGAYSMYISDQHV